MPRTEKPLDALAGPVEAFAHDLRVLREKAGMPPYRVLAKRAGYSASTLSIAASGAVLPSLDVTLAYTQACGGDPEFWRERWQTITAQQKYRDNTALPVNRESHEVVPAAHENHSAQQSAPVVVAITDTARPATTVQRYRHSAKRPSLGLVIRAVLLLTIGVTGGVIGAHATAPDTRFSQSTANSFFAVIILSSEMGLDSDTSADLAVDSGQTANLAQLPTAIHLRLEQVDLLSKLDVTHIPDGQEIKSYLDEFWRDRITFDSLYEAFAEGQGPSGPASVIPRTALKDFETEERQAESEAATLWNLHAQAMGEPQISEGML